MRPGRFDSTVTITLPDVKARHDILKVHAAKVKLSPEVDLEIIARGTAGFSGWLKCCCGNTVCLAGNHVTTM